MRLPSTQLIAVTIFAFGFALVSSGSTSVLRVLMSDRPDWSVCGASMCSCIKLESKPECPLCLLGASSCIESCDDGQPIKPVQRVPKSFDEISAIDGMSVSLGSALFLTLVLPGSKHDLILVDQSRRWSIATALDPGSRSIGVPVPPPRA